MSPAENAPRDGVTVRVGRIPGVWGSWRIEFSRSDVRGILHGQGEVAMAIHLAGQPLPAVGMSPASAAALVMDAIEHHGIAAIQAMAAFDRCVNRQMMAGRVTANELHQRRALWSTRRSNRATGTAYHLGVAAERGELGAAPVHGIIRADTPDQTSPASVRDTGQHTGGPPSVREVASLTARLRVLSATGHAADPGERAAFLLDRDALLNRIDTTTDTTPAGGGVR
jgi:hypothetical protein